MTLICGHLNKMYQQSHWYRRRTHSTNAYLIKGINSGRQATVHAENLVINDGRQTEIVEDFRAVSPNVDGAILLEALIIETVHLSDLAGFVVSADQGNPVRISHLQKTMNMVTKMKTRRERMYPYLQGQQKQERFHTVVATVDEVTEKQVVGVGALASNLEQLNQIVELTMNITADLQENWK